MRILPYEKQLIRLNTRSKFCNWQEKHIDMKRYIDDSMQNSKSQWAQQVHIVSDWKQTNIICKVMRIIHCKNNKLGLKQQVVAVGDMENT